MIQWIPLLKIIDEMQKNTMTAHQVKVITTLEKFCRNRMYRQSILFPVKERCITKPDKTKKITLKQCRNKNAFLTLCWNIGICLETKPIFSSKL